MIHRRNLNRLIAVCLAGGAFALQLPAQAADEQPDAMIQRLSNSVLDNIRSDKSFKEGDISHVIS
ncbi:MAG: hypothetical protein ABJA49_10180, partial [Betaproteobacteria bacterium]